jgi:aryl-alcohol dehydrogenase-like predicted oxidoreductase
MRHDGASSCESRLIGETFAGLPFERGVELADELRWIADGRGTMARAAQRWILESPEVSCIIPGFKNTAQVRENLLTLETPGFSEEERQRLRRFYEDEVAPHIRGPY